MLGPEIYEEPKCECCGRVGIDLRTNVWLKPAMLCKACLCTWYDRSVTLKTWGDLKEASLSSGERWL